MEGHELLGIETEAELLVLAVPLYHQLVVHLQSSRALIQHELVPEERDPVLKLLIYRLNVLVVARMQN